MCLLESAVVRQLQKHPITPDKDPAVGVGLSCECFRRRSLERCPQLPEREDKHPVVISGAMGSSSGFKVEAGKNGSHELRIDRFDQMPCES